MFFYSRSRLETLQIFVFAQQFSKLKDRPPTAAIQKKFYPLKYEFIVNEEYVTILQKNEGYI